jgi:hypothetical protein
LAEVVSEELETSTHGAKGVMSFFEENPLLWQYLMALASPNDIILCRALQ